MTPVESTRTCSGCETELPGETGGGGGGVCLALRAGRGVRDAGVDQHGLRLGEREMALRDRDRGRLDAVRRPQRGADGCRDGAHDGDVGPSGRPDPRRDAARDEALLPP